MEKIKVCEYVRTNSGEIGQVIVIKENPLRYVINECGNIAVNGEIKNHSFNLIDLIEVGDYVNGYCVAKIEKDKSGNITDICYEEEMEMQYYGVGDVKSIVTKEQFEQIEYRVKERM